MMHFLAAELFRAVLSILFVFSGFIKLLDLKGFYRIVLGYGLLSPYLARLTAYAIPFVELFGGAALLLNLFIPWTVSILLVHLIISTSAVIIVVVKQKRMANCGCYGTAIQVPLGWTKVGENLFWVAALALLALVQTGIL